MRITGIHIDGFGIWNDRQWTGLSAKVNVFHGPNEAGKTTLMSFVRSVLFGFERRNHPRRYEPLRGGNHGGALEVLIDGNALRIGRTPGRHVRGAARLHAASGALHVADDEHEQALGRLLGGTTRTLYHNVFAFGLEELEHFRTLEDSEVASHISGAGMGVGASRWSQVWKDIEERRSRLFLSRGQNSTINRALKELESVRDEIAATETEPEAYIAAHVRRSELNAEIRQLEDDAGRLGKQVARFAKLREAEPHRQRRAGLSVELAGLEAVGSFPEGGVERLNLLLHQRRELEAELDGQRAETERIRTERQELAARYAPQELIRRTRSVESLRSLLPRRDAAGQIVAGAAARRDALVRDFEQLRARRDRVGPPSSVATAAFTILMAMGAAGLFRSGQDVGGGFVLAALVAVVGWYGWRRRQAGQLDRELGALSSRVQSAEEELESSEAGHREVYRAIAGLSGHGDFSSVDLEREIRAIEDLGQLADRIRAIDAALTNEERHRERIQQKVEQNARNIGDLLGQGGAGSESEFFRRAEVFRQRQELSAALARIPSVETGGDPETEGFEEFDAEVDRELRGRLEQVEQRLRAARNEAGRIEERIDGLGRSEERSRARLREQSIRARIDEASQQWAVLTLCRTLLDETRRVYETDRQPEVVRHASEFFNALSGGEWRRVVAPIGGGAIFVESADGSRVAPEHLSRGTAEQLYLAMRLALVREYSRHVVPLPVIFDDIFVNFDPDRTRRSVEAVRDLSESHQVLLFTCHPHLLELVEEIVPDARIYPLQ